MRVRNASRNASTVRALACRRTTSKCSCAASNLIAAAPTCARSRRTKCRVAPNSRNVSVSFAPKSAMRAARNVPNTKWTIASAAPKRAGNARKPVVKWPVRAPVAGAPPIVRYGADDLTAPEFVWAASPPSSADRGDSYFAYMVIAAIAWRGKSKSLRRATSRRVGSGRLSRWFSSATTLLRQRAMGIARHQMAGPTDISPATARIAGRAFAALRGAGLCRAG